MRRFFSHAAKPVASCNVQQYYSSWKKPDDVALDFELSYETVKDCLGKGIQNYLPVDKWNCISKIVLELNNLYTIANFVNYMGSSFQLSVENNLWLFTLDTQCAVNG